MKEFVENATKPRFEEGFCPPTPRPPSPSTQLKKIDMAPFVLVVHGDLAEFYQNPMNMNSLKMLQTPVLRSDLAPSYPSLKGNE